MPRDEVALLLARTQAKAKMWEFGVPEDDHIKMVGEPAALFDVTVAALGDAASAVNGGAVSRPSDSEGRFASRFFDAYRRSRLQPDLDSYLTLLAACTFRLYDMPGTAGVLAALVGDDRSFLTDALPRLAWSLLLPRLPGRSAVPGNRFYGETEILRRAVRRFDASGQGTRDLEAASDALREAAYRQGSARELLLADAICAISRYRIRDSSRLRLPDFSGLSQRAWRASLTRSGATRELWPSQLRLGAAGVLRGESAVVQMPTSAGKTRGIEFVLRSAFLAERVELAAVVAPFRALCHEIRRDLEAALLGDGIRVSEVSDVMQMEADTLNAFREEQHVLVLTPEKLLYVLRHYPDLASRLGIVIYDEGHLFDDATRGVSYELLLASIKAASSSSTQTLLVSAALPNAPEVAQWLLGDSAKVVTSPAGSGPNRSIGYVSWAGKRAQVHFPDLGDAQPFAYFVPRVLEEKVLADGESFPDRRKANEIALALALQLVPKGAVAVFCGTKRTASAIMKRAVKVANMGVSLDAATENADLDELMRMAAAVAANLGEHSPLVAATRAGLLCHHGAVPHGLRIAFEYAIRHGLAQVVVCTSTLAQGVNLPVRYLVLTTHRQGAARMKTRDFLNLMGRAGRADRFTEGSVVFADPKILESRGGRDNWRWDESTALVDPSRSEDCSSAILTVLKPLNSDNGRHFLPIDPLQLVRSYLADDEAFLGLASGLARERFTAGGLSGQLKTRLTSLRAIQSFLLANSEALTARPGALDELVESTLAWSLAEEGELAALKELFRLLWEDACRKVSSPERRPVYGRTLLSASECARIEEWLGQNMFLLTIADGQTDLIRTAWPLLASTIRHPTVAATTHSDIVRDCLDSWVSGAPFFEIEAHLESAKIRSATRSRQYTADDTVDLCQNAFGFEGSLILGALGELLIQAEEEATADMVSQLQRLMKHGVPTDVEYELHEMGFTDRVIAGQLAESLHVEDADRDALALAMKEDAATLAEMATGWPAVYRARLLRAIAQGEE